MEYKLEQLNLKSTIKTNIMIRIKLFKDTSCLLSIDTPEFKAKDILITLGTYIANNNNVIGSENKVPTKEDTNGEFIFKCKNYIMKLSTELI